MVPRFQSSPADPAARGEEFGEACSGQVEATVAGYIELFSAASSGPVDVDSLGAQALRRIRSWWPEAADEIEGIARGSGLPPARVAAINARTEILGLCSRRMRGECSTFLALSRSPAGSFAAQTWDWHDHLADNWLVWTVELPGGRVFHTLTEYGILAKVGISSAGLAVLLNILHHRDDGAGIGVPVHVIARRILESSANLNDALSVATTAEVSASTSLTLVGYDDEECSGVCVEVFPGGPGLLVPDEHGIFVRTNHFLSPQAVAGDLEPKIGPDTFLRFDVLRRRLAAERPTSISECFGLLRSHYGGGGAICAHPDADAPMGSRYATLATGVFDFGAGEMAVLAGGPCSDDEPTTFTTAEANRPLTQGAQ
jgi:isopenicillin-N N-acyltransferase-like protein